WVRLSNRFSQLFADTVRIVQRAPIDNKIFFRLRAYGFIDVDDSIRFCAALDAEGAACIPAVKR
ncbi:MAG: SPOR domain-containing protein, partial [Paracoccaceae bacterium]